MNGHTFTFFGAALTALPSGALWWREERLLCVSDLHLGKSERMARRGGPILPPYEVQDTLMRLERDLAATTPECVICLGDSFDDLTAAQALQDEMITWLATLMAGRRWIWIEGNHDAGPVDLGGTHLASHRTGPLTFRHIAKPGASAEISGHYHPKAQLPTRARRITRPCFLLDQARLILPAYGTYTGGLRSSDPALSGLMAADAQAILLTDPPLCVPMPR
ncbi:ligase-associated DNA damage response endonuclease PdeM [Rhodophyticola sp. CCM32]|uniref:ligase-associated DNA damage response endonuclease PdeM n=1 Tax=Rhodophyticola sp. CCM32 TaxID=2916397 RepID=UPI00107FA4A3|nr:ligase-associated DNA damage response endonuclease PdeM [Rhodophyticola sp. CCM32]QBY01197.1 ligase-associated DNA damage response endonuclease PdeM [Rhodophyticola sp. CCM32]